MKVGSIVECVKDMILTYSSVMLDVRIPIKRKIYTVREIMDFDHPDGPSITVEEIINPVFQFDTWSGENTFPMVCFVELLPPIELNILAELELQNGE